MPLTSATIVLNSGAMGEYAPSREATSANVFAEQSEWVEHCCASIFARDSSLERADVLELANTLWERPGCRAVLPEVAADRLFAGQLGSLR